MTYAVLGLCLVAGLGLMGRWLLSAEPRDILRAAKWAGGILAVGIALFVLLRGRLDWLFYIVPFALPFLLRSAVIARSIRNAAKMARGPAPGQSTDVRTQWLAMTLDHDTGAMDGEVLQGRFAGRRLSDLEPEDLQALADDLDGDPESRQVFEAWIERMGMAFDEQAEAGSGDDDSTMTTGRAREILGLDAAASEQDIRDAHRRLMMANHPDRGGSSWVAAQINRAKDVLLGKS